MAYAYAIDPAVPANTDFVRDGALVIREYKSAVIERLASFFDDIDNDPLQGIDGAEFVGDVIVGGTVTGTFAGNITGNVTGNVTGNLTGNVTGNASTATALQTPRTINGTSFDGTANITVTAAAGTLTGATLAAGVTASSLTSVGTIATGVWQGTAVDATHGGTNQTSWTTGDFMYASGANTLAKRGIGSSGDVLTVTGGVPVWAPVAVSSTFTTLIQTTLTTEQLRLRYDASYYLSVTVEGNNLVTFNNVSPGTTSYQFRNGGTLAVTMDAFGIKTVAPSGGTAKYWKFGAVASVSPTSQNRTIELEVDGTTYYITAKTTNN